MSDDPMADFLAREKAALGDDAELFATGSAPTAPSGVDLTSMSEQTSCTGRPPAKSPSPRPSGMDAFPSLDSPGINGSEFRVTGVAGTGQDEEMEKFTSAFPDLSDEVRAEAPPKPVFNALAAQPYGSSPYANTAPPKSSTSILPPPPLQNTLPEAQEDTEPIKEWRARQAEEIKRRDENDRKARDEMKNKAEKSIDAFYEEYNKLKEKNIRENKENEAAFLEKLRDGTAKGSAWERVTELISLENSQSKTIRPSVPGGSDLARMREILLALRREGDKAPGAAGF
ncbi:clathrin light chain [Kockovaella imperatae]|uniref:Clathrin light chain n=1 Tax=Kockovaella imperatae TaxID=4999 RepID=A0A1Y1UDG3_9TREE|nr:clathrin light chain [Kockovaella imperatae]ORX35556.1 clathrin light chain [Kockovaella imperatae]